MDQHENSLHLPSKCEWVRSAHESCLFSTGSDEVCCDAFEEDTGRLFLIFSFYASAQRFWLLLKPPISSQAVDFRITYLSLLKRQKRNYRRKNLLNNRTHAAFASCAAQEKCCPPRLFLHDAALRRNGRKGFRHKPKDVFTANEHLCLCNIPQTFTSTFSTAKTKNISPHFIVNDSPALSPLTENTLYCDPWSKGFIISLWIYERSTHQIL